MYFVTKDYCAHRSPSEAVKTMMPSLFMMDDASNTVSDYSGGYQRQGR